MRNDVIELEKIGERIVPVNVVMGELGSGKTTVIMNLVKQVAGDGYRVVWLKNEYGDLNVDGMLAREQGIETAEVMNGCLCCTSVGRLEDALKEILKLSPDRIVIETAGTAHPAPIAMELKRFPDIMIDSFMEVVDAVNFAGYGDLSMVGKSHAKYVDFVVVNKVGLVDGRRLDRVIDLINDNYTDIPRLMTEDGSVPARLAFGADRVSSAGRLPDGEMAADAHSPEAHRAMESFTCRTARTFRREEVEAAVRALPPRDVYRTKGIVRTPAGCAVMNGVANRITWQPVSRECPETEILFVGPTALEHEAAVRSVLEGPAEGTGA